MANEIPNPLPKVLPVGTMNTRDRRAQSEVTLKQSLHGGHPQYWANWGRGYDTWCSPEEINWSSLPASPAPPPDVAAPGDRLFESGCCLCGGDGAGSLTKLSPGRANEEMLFCSACWRDRPNGCEEIDAEITRRRALQTPPAPEKWEGKVGDWVRSKLKPSVVYQVRSRRATGFLDVRSVVGGNDYSATLGSFIQWAPERGEMCEGIVAPGVNAAGETVRGGFIRREPDGEIVLDLGKEEGAAWVLPESLRPAAPKGEGERKAADPYADNGDRPAEHDVAACTVPMNDMRRDERIAALSTGDELSQLAARRQRQRVALLGEMDDGKARREAVRHASDWDVSDAPECYSTHGSGQ